MTLFNDIMPYSYEFIHVYGWNMSILWFPLKIWTPKNFTTDNFRHPVSKSWLTHWPRHPRPHPNSYPPPNPHPPILSVPISTTFDWGLNVYLGSMCGIDVSMVAHSPARKPFMELTVCVQSHWSFACTWLTIFTQRLLCLMPLCCWTSVGCVCGGRGKGQGPSQNIETGRQKFAIVKFFGY